MESLSRMSSSSRRQAEADSHGDSQESSILRTSASSENTSQDRNKSEFLKWQVSTELGRDEIGIFWVIDKYFIYLGTEGS